MSLGDKREDNQNCSVLYCIEVVHNHKTTLLYVFTVIFVYFVTKMSLVLYTFSRGCHEPCCPLPVQLIAGDCLVLEMTSSVSSEMLNPTHSCFSSADLLYVARSQPRLKNWSVHPSSLPQFVSSFLRGFLKTVIK